MLRRDGPQWFGGTSGSARLGNLILADRFRELGGQQEFHLHDPVAVAAAIDPDILMCRRARMSVITDGEERGRTIANYGDGPVRVAVGIHVGRAMEIVRSVISA